MVDVAGACRRSLRRGNLGVAPVTRVAWSPTRPCVLFALLAGAALCVFDLAASSAEPAAVVATYEAAPGGEGKDAAGDSDDAATEAVCFAAACVHACMRRVWLCGDALTELRPSWAASTQRPSRSGTRTGLSPSGRSGALHAPALQ